jgi:pimeloyl-ACP methyl ester carboxylesterase
MMTQSPAVRDEVVTVRGVDVQVRIHGDGGMPVVLLPGGGVACADYYPNLVEGLADQTVIVHDRLGTGRSRTDEPVSLRTWSDDTAALLDGLGMERALLVGHSLGGALAVQVVLDHPDRVAGALLLDPTPLNDPASCAKAAKGASVIARFCRKPVVGPATEWLLKRVSRPRGLSPDARQAFAQTFSGSWLDDTAATVVSLAEDARAYAERTVAPADVPVLLVSADRKPKHRVRMAHVELAAALGARFEVWPKTQHSLYLQRPQLVIDRTRQLLEAS